MVLLTTNLNFNSIKVRLELDNLCVNVQKLAEFQFHKGTIRTQSLLSTDNFNSHFNSIKVRLERCIFMHPFNYYTNFNSIKVRLELSRY